ncbi:hypothetical protein GCM10023208_00270 [Erythrobacter westpacificensis]|uniref:site-specific DNA-methyltransferase (adenine-specific) n=1 Tax=Erythrobacter westpacificensis TaxID=1055231 RepID=A0ABP9JYB8_9SPHN
MPAPKIISDLVERFRLHKDAYQASSYNETQVRREFIDPFFKALGWDIDNEQGYAEAYKDVVHEDALKIGGNTKAPDYAFRIGGTRKFFLEAKKPSVNIKQDVGPAFQLRRYAWSAKLPLSILTDFEEFAVYDCRVKPERTDKASVARTVYYTFEDYLDKWDEIEAIFSREAVLKGSFDKYAADNRRKRGTAEVDDAFLEEIESWRAALARNIALRNQDLDVRELNAAVQRTIDRIVFLRIAEDRGIERYGQLQALTSGKEVYEGLASLFRKADDRYNSGLFHFRKGDGSPETLDTFTLDLEIDDKVLKSILKSLYYPDSPYEFSVLPADILGQVYERFLGKVIRLAGTRAIIEEKPEVKKAGGVYYTPAYIVDYIVNNTLGKLLEGKTPSQASGEDGRAKDRSPIRVLDPACGSGSFLIGAYQFLLEWYRDAYVADGPAKHAGGKEPKLMQTGKDDWRLTIAERRRILLTHIYGVDIDTQAVEVTKLSLLLKVLEGETADAMARQMDFFHIRALPDLGHNIRCGNSLIGSDFYGTYSYSLFSDDDHIAMNVFDWEAEFPFLKRAGGFDCVIGNPPYLFSAGKDQALYYQDRYELTEYQTDFYVYFIERGINLLKDGGIISYIVPDSWLNSANFSRVRHTLLNDWATESVSIFDYKVFKDANIENTVFFTRNAPPLKALDVIKFKSPVEYGQVNSLNVSDINRVGLINPHYEKRAEKIISRLDKGFANFGSLVRLNRGLHAYRTDGYGASAYGKGPQTKRDKDERSYHADSPMDKTYLPEVRGRDVFWLTYRYSGQYVSYGDWLAEPRDPDFMHKPKAVFRKTLGPILSAAYIEESAAIDQALYIAISKSDDTQVLKTALGVLTSPLGAWYLRTKYAIYDRLHPWYTKKQLEEFPMLPSSSEIAGLVDALTEVIDEEGAARVESHRRRLKLKSDMLREELWDVVARAYGLSETEKSIIAPDF